MWHSFYTVSQKLLKNKSLIKYECLFWNICQQEISLFGISKREYQNLKCSVVNNNGFHRYYSYETMLSMTAQKTPM